MTPAEVLRVAREKIATPERWTKDVLARDVGGSDIDPGARGAACFCAEGAITAALGPDPDDLVYSRVWACLRQAACEANGGFISLYKYNDAPERTHADVLALFDRAIALAEAP